MGRSPAGQTRAKVYEFVSRRLQEGRPPTVREVQRAFRFSAVETARAHLEALVAEGRLVKTPGRSRSYRRTGYAGTLVPLLGRVAAGGPAYAVEDIEGYLPLESHDSRQESFALRIRGRSMEGAGILDGDIVVVRKQSEAASGDIVVALLGEEATVKRLRVRGSSLRLCPENPDFEPMTVKAAELVILGKVVEVRRYIDGIPLVHPQR